MGLRDRLKGALKRAGGRSGPNAAEPSTIQRRTAARRDLPDAPDADGYVAVAAASLLAEGKGTTFRVHGTNVAIYRVGGTLHAIDDACTHEDGPLGEGDLDGMVVTCPYHDWRFDVSTGACLTDETRPVSCFAVRERDGFIWVGSKVREGTDARGGEHDDGLKTRLVE